nr:MAG TPA: hypothetical protein [Caudoviricetes sp.]
MKIMLLLIISFLVIAAYTAAVCKGLRKQS